MYFSFVELEVYHINYGPILFHHGQSGQFLFIPPVTTSPTRHSRLQLAKHKVKSGMLILPNPTVPNAVWEIAETEEMKEVIGLYGKTFHFWQVDRGDLLPLGMPELMMSFTANEQVSKTCLAKSLYTEEVVGLLQPVILNGC